MNRYPKGLFRYLEVEPLVGTLQIKSEGDVHIAQTRGRVVHVVR